MFLGFLAPAAITVEYEGEEQAAAPLTFRNFQLPMRLPLVASQDTGDAATSETRAIGELLVSAASAIGRGVKSAFQLPDVAAAGDDQKILLDDEANVEGDVVDRLLVSTQGDEPILAVDLTPLWDPAVFDVIPGPLRTWGERQDDDFIGDALVFRDPVPQPVEVPEPESAGLVILGLLGIALGRRTA